MMKPIFAFSGQIGSGKSSVSRAFAERVGAAWNGFGTTVREIATERGLPLSRESLQEIGAFEASRNRVNFCKGVVQGATADSTQAIVIDGLRHFNILEELRSAGAPRPVFCVFIDVPPELRRERVRRRDGLSPQQLADFDQHSTEVEVEQKLKGAADLIVHNLHSPIECVEKIMVWANNNRL